MPRDQLRHSPGGASCPPGIGLGPADPGGRRAAAHGADRARLAGRRESAGAGWGGLSTTHTLAGHSPPSRQVEPGLPPRPMRPDTQGKARLRVSQLWAGGAQGSPAEAAPGASVVVPPGSSRPFPPQPPFTHPAHTTCPALLRARLLREVFPAVSAQRLEPSGQWLQRSRAPRTQNCLRLARMRTAVLRPVPMCPRRVCGSAPTAEAGRRRPRGSKERMERVETDGAPACANSCSPVGVSGGGPSLTAGA